MMDSFFRRILSPIVTFYQGEAVTGVWMFVYSFLVMMAYNNIKPSAASKFIDEFGAENTAWVFLVAGLSMGFIMNYYSRGVGKVPKLWVLPGTQLVLTALLLGFWLLFQTGAAWVSAAFFFFGRLLLGIFLISQFWTLANEIYDPRQAKRLFGFIGGGASLGGMTGAGLTALLVESVGTVNLILFSAAVLFACFFLILEIQRRTKPTQDMSFATRETVGGGEALSMVRKSKHLQLISLIIGFSALGAVTLEFQLYMASDAIVEGMDSVTSFLAEITFYISAISFFIQVYLTSRIYAWLGIGFALAVLPVSLGATAVVILLSKALWASSLARVTDSALRYSLDKTTRETLFLPLPAELKLKAKGFVDVVSDRFIGKGLGGVVLLVATKLLGFTWWQLSFLSIAYCGLWLVLTRYAKREYMAVFRRSIESLELAPDRLTRAAGDAATIETLVEELGSRDEQRVLRSIELLESLDKQNLISPLLLRHDSPRVRSRALEAIREAAPELRSRWIPAAEASLKDDDPEVRSAAVEVLASAHDRDVHRLMAPYLDDADPRVVAAAAVALGESPDEADRERARRRLEEVASDERNVMAHARREVARAVAGTTDPRFRQLLLPLMHDSDPDVAEEAIRSARQLGDADLLFVPALVSLLRVRRLKNAAREALVSYGEDAVPALSYFLQDEDEDPWVRRHIPGTLAAIPSRASVEALLACFESDDGFLRYKSILGLEKMQRENGQLSVPEAPVERLVVKEATKYYRYLGAYYDLFQRGELPRDTLLGQALREKQARIKDRIYRLLGVLYDWSDIRAARLAIERGDTKARSSAVEFLDNTLVGEVRKVVLPLVDELPESERVKKGNVFLKTRSRSVEETLTRLIYDGDPVVAATAIDLVREEKVWSLADDLEQVLQFRDAKDFAVFESASYALAAFRLKTDEPYAV